MSNLYFRVHDELIKRKEKEKKTSLLSRVQADVEKIEKKSEKRPSEIRPYKPSLLERVQSAVMTQAAKVMPREEWVATVEKEKREGSRFLQGISERLSPGMDLPKPPEVSGMEMISYPLKQIYQRPAEMVRAPFVSAMKGEPVGEAISRMLRAGIQPGKAETVMGQIPFQEAEQGHWTRLIPRAIISAIEDFTVYTGSAMVKGGITGKATRVEKAQTKKLEELYKKVDKYVPKFEEAMKKAGHKFPKDMSLSDKSRLIVENAKYNPDIAKPVKHILMEQPDIIKMYSGVPVPKIGDMVPIGGKTGEIIKIAGANAIVKVAGKSVWKKLADIIPKEKVIQPTKQEPEFKKIVESAGGEWKGVQKGLPAEKGQPEIESIVLFDVPGTKGATAALPVSKVTPESVKAKILAKQKEFGVGPQKPIRPIKQEPKFVKAKREASKTTIRKTTGVQKVKDIVDLPESTLLKLKFKSEVKGSKEGLKAGKEAGKIIGEIKGGKTGLRTGLRVGKKFAFRVEKNKRKVRRALDSIFKKYDHPEKSIDFNTLKEVEKIQSKMSITKPSQLGDTTIEELESIAHKVVGLRKRGEKVFRRKRRIERLKHENSKREILDAISRGTPPRVPKAGEEIKPTFGAETYGTGLRVYHPLRVYDKLDGKKNFQGPTARFFYRKGDKGVSDELRGKIDREKKVATITDAMSAGRKRIWGRTVGKKWEHGGKTINGIEFSNMDRVYYYLANDNPQQKMAVIYANRISPKTFDKVVESLTSQEIEYAKKLRDIVGEKFEQVREIRIAVDNVDVGHVDSYFPIHRVKDYLSFGEELAEEMLFRTSLGHGKTDVGFTLSREQVRKVGQTRINTNALEVAMRAIEAQEHMIAFLPLQKQWKTMLSDPEVSQAIKMRIGKVGLKMIEKNVDEMINPSLVYAHREPLIAIARQNMTVAYLFLNPPSILVQAASLPMALRESSPADIAKAATEVVVNYKKTKDFIYKRDPQVERRKQEREIEEMKKMPIRPFAGQALTDKISNVYTRIRKKFGKECFRPFMYNDHMTCLTVWKAVYNSAIRHNLGETAAIEKAHDAFILTQPQAATKDLPDVMRAGDMLKNLTVFSNQLYQIFGAITHDIPSYIKNKDPKKALATMVSLIVASGMVWAIRNKRWPKTKEEIKEALSDNAISSIPFVGKPLAQVAKGSYWGSVDDATLRAVNAALEVLKVKKAKTKWKKAAESLSVGLGIPLNAPKRIKRYFGNEQKKFKSRTGEKLPD